MSKGSLQVISCKAAVCWGEGEPLVIEEIQVEPPQASEVRVKMICASLCHTDILCRKGYPLALFPRVLGHEGAGIVESVGEGVTELKEGDLVIPALIGECKECGNCGSGRTNLCLKYPTMYHGLMLDNSSRISVRGQRLYHLFTCSTWSEYMVVNVNYVVKIDPRVPPPHASLLSCTFSTGFGATWKEAKVGRGSSVAVLGLGGVGLAVVEGARIRGASKIIGVDLNENKREKGKVFGMTDFINPEASDKSVAQAIKEITGGSGVDYSFECTGVASLISEGLESTAPGRGVAIVIGASKEVTTSVSLTSLILGRTLKGSIFGGIKPQSDLQSIVDEYINQELHLDALVTHEIQLDEINQAFELLKRPDCVKVGRGFTIAFGVSNKGTAPISLIALISGRTLKGSVFGGIKPQTDLPTIIEKCINEELELDALVSHEVQLEDINQAFELLKQADCLKVVIQINRSLNY